jgi:hypothetical protein
MDLILPAQSSSVEFISRPKDIDYQGWPSPFDDSGVQYAWDSTSLGLLKTCPRKYQLSMVLNWQPKKRSHHLDFGIYYHSAIEHYEKIMADPRMAVMPEINLEAGGVTFHSLEDKHEFALRSTIRKAMIDSLGYEPGDDPKSGNQKNDKTRFNLIRSLVWYFEQFGLADPCKTVILSNGKPAVELSFRFEIGQGLVLSGHLDRIVTYGDGTYVMDHKTTSSTVTGASARYYFKNFNPDNQMSLYSVGAAVAFATPVKGVIIDAAQIAVGFTAFGRDFTHRTERQLHEFLEGVYSYRRLAEQFEAAGFWPMNETACGNYGGCAFRDICARDPAVRERFLRTDFTQDRPWNPLEPR